MRSRVTLTLFGDFFQRVVPCSCNPEAHTQHAFFAAGSAAPRPVSLVFRGIVRNWIAASIGMIALLFFKKKKNEVRRVGIFLRHPIGVSRLIVPWRSSSSLRTFSSGRRLAANFFRRRLRPIFAAGFDGCVCARLVDRFDHMDRIFGSSRLIGDMSALIAD